MPSFKFRVTGVTSSSTAPRGSVWSRLQSPIAKAQVLAFATVAVSTVYVFVQPTGHEIAEPLPLLTPFAISIDQGYIEPDVVVPEKRRLELVLVVDATVSMAEWLKELRGDEAIAAVSAELQGSGLDLWLGLVAYRDDRVRPSDDLPTVEWIPLRGTVEYQLEGLAGLAKSTEDGGEDWLEDQLMGLQRAIRLWETDVSDDSHASRAIVVVTDASLRDPDSQGNTLAGITTKLNDLDVAVYSLVVAAARPEERVHTDAAALALVQGANPNADPERRIFAAERYEDFVPRLVEVFQAVGREARGDEDTTVQDSPTTDSPRATSDSPFLLRLSDAYGQQLELQLELVDADWTVANSEAADQVGASLLLVSDNFTLKHTLPGLRSGNDSKFQIPIVETAWTQVTSGDVLSADEFREQLSSAKSLTIEGHCIGRLQLSNVRVTTSPLVDE